MEWPKLKNIIILILLLVNGFLLVLVVGREFQVSRYERSAFTQAGQVLAQNGITVDEDLLEQAVRESLVPLFRVKCSFLIRASVRGFLASWMTISMHLK